MLVCCSIQIILAKNFFSASWQNSKLFEKLSTSSAPC